MTKTLERTELEIDLKAVIRQVLESSASRSIHKLIKEVVERIRDEDMHDALAQALHQVILSEMSLLRNRPIETPRPSGVGNRRIRLGQSLAMKLDSRVPMGDGSTKLLRELTCDDLNFAAARREAQASALLDRAEEFRRLATALAENSVTTVGELPEGVLLELLAN